MLNNGNHTFWLKRCDILAGCQKIVPWKKHYFSYLRDFAPWIYVNLHSQLHLLPYNVEGSDGSQRIIFSTVLCSTQFPDDFWFLRPLCWTDPRLTWDPLKEHNIQEVKLDFDQVWRPDVVPYSKQKPTQLLGSYQAIVYSNGMVLMIPEETNKVMKNTWKYLFNFHSFYYADFLPSQCWQLAIWTSKLHLQNGQLALQPQRCQYSRQSWTIWPGWSWSRWRYISHQSIHHWRPFSLTRWIKVFVLHRTVSAFEYFYRISKTQNMERKCGQLQFDPNWSFVSRKITIESKWSFVLWSCKS